MTSNRHTVTGFDARTFRDTLAQYATGVTIITAQAQDGRLLGFTANSFNSVSLEPPLILWSLASASRSLPGFEAATHYAVNVLAQEQRALAQRFAERRDDRFNGIGFHTGASGAPLIDDCVAWLECRPHARYDVGDHVLFVGQVEACGWRSGEPLLWHGSDYAALASIPPIAR